MKIRKLLKKDKGAITIYVMLSVVFFAIFVIGIYILANRKLQMQYEAIKMASNAYNDVQEADPRIDDEYIPIYNEEQLNLVGTDSEYYVYQKGENIKYTNGGMYTLEDNIKINKVFKTKQETENDEDYNSSNDLKQKIENITRVNSHIREFTNGFFYYDNGWNFSNIKSVIPTVMTAENYGDYVDYGIDLNGDGDTTNDWRIFLDDEDSVYLIAADYVTDRWVPNSSNYQITKHSDYKFSFANVYKDYAGASDIVNNEKLKPTLSKYHKWINNNQNSTNLKTKVVAYMLDTTIWSSKLGNKYAEYAIGAPTIEMFYNSYTKKGYSPKMYYESNSNGYYSRTENGSNTWPGNLNTTDNLYIITSQEKARAMWIASTHAIGSEYIFDMDFSGWTNYRSHTQNTNGFRPIVCLKSKTKIIYDFDNNIWKLEINEE